MAELITMVALLALFAWVFFDCRCWVAKKKSKYDELLERWERELDRLEDRKH